jgi:hypothetical protein
MHGPIYVHVVTVGCCADAWKILVSIAPVEAVGGRIGARCRDVEVVHSVHRVFLPVVFGGRLWAFLRVLVVVFVVVFVVHGHSLTLSTARGGHMSLRHSRRTNLLSVDWIPTDRAIKPAQCPPRPSNALIWRHTYFSPVKTLTNSYLSLPAGNAVVFPPNVPIQPGPNIFCGISCSKARSWLCRRQGCVCTCLPTGMYIKRAHKRKDPVASKRTEASERAGF